MMVKQKVLSKPFSEQEFKALTGLWKVDRVILDTLDYNYLIRNIVNTILTELDYLKLGYKIIVLALVNKKKNIIERVAISKTKAAKKALEETPIPFKQIEVPLSSRVNLLVKAIKNKKIYITHDLSDVLLPAGNRKEWRYIQHVCRIQTSVVYPVIARKEALGTMIFSLSKHENEISSQEWEVLAGFTNAVGIALENASLYRRLKESNQRLRDLDKQKDEFISVAAHELRAPMTAIKGYLSMILEGDAGPVPEKIADYLKEATEGNERLIRLVNNMLNVGRIEEGRMIYQMGKVNLRRVVETVFNEFKVEAEKKGLKFNLVIPQEINDQIYVDQDRIHEVVANFVSNAVKYTDQGEIIIKLSQPANQIIRLEVRDTGPGIAEKDRIKLFQKFSRAESSSGKKLGTGLGLYISKLLIEKFGGKIGFDSKIGVGSTFWFELPVRK